MTAVRLKVLVATGAYPPEIGGPATYSKTLYDALPRAGFAVDVLPFSEVRRFPKLIRHLAYFFRALKRGAFADIIYAQDPVSVGLPASFAAFILRKKFLLKVVGDYAWEQGVQRFGLEASIDEYLKNPRAAPFLVRVLREVEITVARHAEKIIVPSEYLKRVVMSWRLPAERIVVIHNGVEQDVAVGAKPILRGLVRFSGKVVITVGRLVPWKHFEEIIDIVPKLKKSFPEMRLLIVGSGPLMGELEARARAHGVAEEVVFTGALPREVLLNYLKLSDVFVLNSSYEGFSHQLLEAFMVGVPVVATDAGGNSEIVGHNVNGLLVPQGDRGKLASAVSQVLSDVAVRTRLTGAGKRRAKEFSNERMIAETVAVLKKAVT
jgi:glycosyltransferase involved in cell wall biosynthesis